ncbi:hypothetical protein CERSUDRAFT_92781 [Gelatoporia subvermispora B]|uniref:Uncharacterized protein n=1 Tax=Ceriporiopsis subvermispora (strain B) TaxID=914234 RepID=M2QNV7_CERS8|nr:hypothetical protein CERSUDRAFT_92781 [Gelatoporia subvermispora B]
MRGDRVFWDNTGVGVGELRLTTDGHPRVTCCWTKFAARSATMPSAAFLHSCILQAVHSAAPRRALPGEGAPGGGDGIRIRDAASRKPVILLPREAAKAREHSPEPLTHSQVPREAGVCGVPQVPDLPPARRSESR